MARPDDEQIMQHFERESRRRSEGVRAMIREMGREDVLADYDKNMRDLALGLTGAQSAWHSISPAQRRVLLIMSTGRVLRRHPGSKTRYDAIGLPHAESNVCGIATVRNLTAREMCACDGTAFDPEAKIVLTERGQFVIKHGPVAP